MFREFTDRWQMAFIIFVEFLNSDKNVITIDVILTIKHYIYTLDLVDAISRG